MVRISRRLVKSIAQYAAPEIAVVVFAAIVIAGIWGVVYWRLATEREKTYEQAQAELLGAQNILAALERTWSRRSTAGSAARMPTPTSATLRNWWTACSATTASP